MNQYLFDLINFFAGKYPILDGLGVFFASYLEYILVAVLLSFVFLGKEKTQKRRNILMLILGFLAAIAARLGVTELIRFFYCHPRPFAAGEINQLILTDEICSFPSGHAAFFFALSMVVFLNNWRWGIWFFAGSILMGLARIFAGVHYPLDILGGAVSGLIIGWLMNKIFCILQSKNTR